MPSRYAGLVVSSEDHGVTVLDPSPLLATLVADVDAGVPVPLLAAAFHEALGTATGELAASLAAAADVDAVALTGGVFQNVRLTEVVESTLRQAGCDVLVHARDPGQRRRHQHRPSGHRRLAEHPRCRWCRSVKPRTVVT